MIRYPRSGKGRRWTVAEFKAIPPTWKGDILADGDGLVGSVRTAFDGAVSLHFRYGFKWNGKKAWHYCGTWPTASLEQIRSARDDARVQLRSGLNPNEARTASRIERRAQVQETLETERRRAAEELTFAAMYAAWLEDGVLRKDGNAEIRRSFTKDLIPALGAQLVKDITEHELRAALRAVVARGANRAAVTLFRDLRQLFFWAEKRQPWRRLLQEGNPASLLEIEKIVATDYDLSNIRTRTLSMSEIGELHSIVLAMDRKHRDAPDRRKAARPLQPQARIALWLCLSTACRIGELLLAEWKHVDLDTGTWFIPVENVKGTRGKKQEHRIYLSDFARSQFRALHAINGNSRWCFPSRDGKTHLDLKTVTKQVGDRQHRFKQRGQLSNRRNDNSLVLAQGRYGEWTPHDLRRTAATMMQALGVAPDVIDRCQNHVLAGSRVRRHYLTHEYAAETREAWRRLGEAIETAIAQHSRQTSSIRPSEPIRFSNPAPASSARCCLAPA